MLSEPLQVVAQVVRALDQLDIPYVVGGSLASSIYGIPRATQDVDLVAAIKAEHADPLAALLEPSFYVDAGMILEAVDRSASFNIIHLETMFKADVFVMKRDPWSREEMRRARTERLEASDGMLAVRFASPEDTLLHKLLWYRLGNEISDRQWNDIVGILKVQAGRLDNGYLDRWADALDVAGLLARARSAR